MRSVWQFLIPFLYLFIEEYHKYILHPVLSILQQIIYLLSYIPSCILPQSQSFPYSACILLINYPKIPQQIIDVINVLYIILIEFQYCLPDKPLIQQKVPGPLFYLQSPPSDFQGHLVFCYPYLEFSTDIYDFVSLFLSIQV